MHSSFFVVLVAVAQICAGIVITSELDQHLKEADFILAEKIDIKMAECPMPYGFDTKNRNIKLTGRRVDEAKGILYCDYAPIVPGTVHLLNDERTVLVMAQCQYQKVKDAPRAPPYFQRIEEWVNGAMVAALLENTRYKFCRLLPGLTPETSMHVLK